MLHLNRQIIIAVLAALAFPSFAYAWTEQCRKIDCQCNAVSADYLPDAFASAECRTNEHMIRNACYTGRGSFSQTCNSSYFGEGAWPLSGENNDRTQAKRQVLDTAIRLDAWGHGSPKQRHQIAREALAELRKHEDWFPGLELANETVERTLNSEETAYGLSDALNTISGGAINREQINHALNSLFYAQSRIESSTPLTRKRANEAHAVYLRLKSLGIDFNKLAEHESGTFRFIGRILSMNEDSPDAAENSDLDSRRFTDNMTFLLPSGTDPDIRIKVTGYYSDLTDWNDSMWSRTVEGLNIVADALETGWLDSHRLRRLSSDIHQMVHQGPWKSQSRRELQHAMSNIPVASDVINAFWRQ